MSDRSENKSEEPLRSEDSEKEPLFPVRGYILLNILFWAFCIVEVLIIRWWLKDIQGIVFFFGLLAIGFTLVSIYDGVYDRMTARSRSNPDGRPPSSSATSTS